MFAQDKNIDSLKTLLNGKEDTTTVWLLKELGDQFNSNIDSAYRYYQKGLQLAKKINFISGQWRLRHDLSELLYRTGSYPQALKISLETLKLAEELNDTMNIYWSMRDVMMTYEYMPNESEQVLKYADKLKNIIFSGFFKEQKTIDFFYLLGYVNHIMTYYSARNQLDSVLYYCQRAYDISMRSKEDQLISIALGNLANIYEKLGDTGVAFSYYRKNIPLSIKAGRWDILVGTKVSIANLFQGRKQIDSALYYCRQALQDAYKTTDPSATTSIYSTLSDLYKEQSKYDSSYKYLKLSIAMRDSLYSQDKLKDIQNQSFAETIRQQDIADQKAKEKDERRQNLQMIGIGVFIITFFLFVLLLSRRKKNIKAISFLAIVALLMVFEFIAMMAHPYIEEWTHHTPPLMLLILVAIASILVPMHHKLEGWIKSKLIKKTTVYSDELQEEISPVK
jgi:tetratricopeptide (TPR) repeat protein